METRSDHSEQILAEQVKLIYREGFRLVLSGLVASLAVAWVFWGVANSTVILTWLGFYVIYLLFRAYLLWAYSRLASAHIDSRLWIRRAMAVLVVGGCYWGAAAILFFPAGPLEYRLFLSVMLFGAILSSMITLAVHLPAFLCFVLPIGTLTPLTYALQGDLLHWGIAIGGIILLVMCINFGRYIQSSFTESQRLRFELAERNQELAERNREVERAGRAKTQFLAAASHDLRQPLHALGLFVDALEHAVHDPKAQQLVNQIRASSDALDDLLNSLLDISKLDAGVIQAQVQVFPLQPLFDKLYAEFQALAGAKNLELRLVKTRALVDSDPELLERILRNLIGNAIRYTETGRVLIGCRRRRDWICVGVWDTGRGIAADKIGDIFQEFVQLDNPERDRQKGLGLGLAIVHRTAQILNYPVQVSSEPGRGSVFYVELPLAQESAMPAPTAHAPPPANAQLQDRLILVVDDEAPIREGMEIVLSDWGCQVLLAAAEQEVIALMTQEGLTPDALIVDYRLPGAHNGLQIIATAHKLLGRSIPAIVMTGDTAPERLQEAEAAGYPLLHKPVKPAQLRSLLNHVLAQQL